MDIQQIRNFLKLSDELHFGQTADILKITQSTLSRQIQALEDELGISLFERNKRNVNLTKSGMYLKQKWTVLLDDLDHIHSSARKISKGETGHIKIAHPESISSSLIPDFISVVAERYPEITIELVQMLYKNIEESLQDYKIDLAFTSQISKLNRVCSQKINSQPVALFIPANHPFVGPEDVTGASLESQRFILPIAEHQSRFYSFVQEIFKFYKVEPKASYYSNIGSSMLGLVSRGLGIAILPIGFVHHGTPAIRAIEIPFTSEIYINWRINEKSQSLLNVINVISALSQGAKSS